jgi:transketolase
LVAQAGEPDFVFLTGDVGFMALEPLRDAAKERFINAGVAEQNMISVAAGLACAGLRPWVYSIAPFLYARAFEQIRNDVCLHKLPVFLVGNGGGYGYGVMGPTHHALEDYGVLLGLPNLTVYIPAFAADVPATVMRLRAAHGPAYLRLGRDETPQGYVPPRCAPWRRLLSGGSATVVVVGPLAGGILALARDLPEARRPSVWVLAELPVRPTEIPAALLDDIHQNGHVLVAEEHVAHGGAGASLAHAFAAARIAPRRFSHRFALGYPGGRYGSQHYHRRESGLDASSILKLATAI